MDEEKFIDRVEIMLYNTCGCNKEEAVIILEKCLERAKNGAIEQKDKKRNAQERMKLVEKWAEYVRTHSDEEWSRQQNILINSVMQNVRDRKG
jgi:hypothetical protein